MIGDLQQKVTELSSAFSHEMHADPGLYVLCKDGMLRYVKPEDLEDRGADLESELDFMLRMHRQALQSPQPNDLRQDGIVAWIRGKLEEIVLVVVECESSTSTAGVHRSTWFVPTERIMEPGKSIPTYVVTENWRIPVTTHINEVKLRCSLYYNAVRCPPCRYGVRLSTQRLIPLTDDGWDTAERVYRRMQAFRSIRTFPEDGEEQPPLFDRIVTVSDLEVHIMSRAGVMVKYSLPRFHEEFDRVAMINRAELHKRLCMIAQAGREKTARVSLHRTRQGESSMIASAVRDDATLIPDTEMTFKQAKNKPPYLLCYDKRSGSYEIRMDGLPAWPSLYLDDKDRVLASDYRIKWRITEFMHLGGIIEVRVAGHCPGYVARPYDETAERVAAVDSQSDQETQYFVRRFRQWVTSLPLNTVKVVGLADGQFSLLAVIKQTDTDTAVLRNAAADWAKHYLQSGKAQFTKVAVWHGNAVVAVLKREQIPGRVVITGRSVGKSTSLAARGVIPAQDKLAAVLSNVRCAVYNAYGLAPYKFTNFPLQLCATVDGVELAEHVKDGTMVPRFLVQASGEIQMLFPSLEGVAGQEDLLKGLGGDREETATQLSMAGWHYAAKQALRYSHEGAIPDGTGWLLFDNTRGAGQWQPTWIHSFPTEDLPEAAVREFIRERAELASAVLRWILISPVGDVYIVGSDMEKPVPAEEFFGMRWTERTVLSKGWQMPCKAGTAKPASTKSLDELKAKLVAIPTGQRRQCIVRVYTDLRRTILQDVAVAEGTSDDCIMVKMREIELGADDLCLAGLAPSGRILFRYQADSMSSAYTEVTGEQLLQQGPETVKVLTQAFSQMIQTSFGRVRVRDWNGFLDKVAQVLRCSEAGVLSVGLWSTAPEDQRDREIKLLREQKTKLQLGVTQLIQQLRLIEEPLVGDPTQMAFSGRVSRDTVTVLCELAGVVTTNAFEPKVPDPLVMEQKLKEAIAGIDWPAEQKAMREERRKAQQVRGPIQILPNSVVVDVGHEALQQDNSVLTSPDFYLGSLSFQLRYYVHRATEEQTRFEHKTMTTGHLLLGILKAGAALSNWLRIGHNVELRNARMAFEMAYKLMSPALEFQYSPETLECLREAEKLAKEQQVPTDGSHLLQAILTRKESIGCKVLEHLKVDRELLLQQIQEARSQGAASVTERLEESAYEQFTMTVPPGKPRDDQADALAAACLALAAYPGMEGAQFKEGFLKTAAVDDLKKLLRDMTDVIVAHPPCGGGEVPTKKYTDLFTEWLDRLLKLDYEYYEATAKRLQEAGTHPERTVTYLHATAKRLMDKLDKMAPDERTATLNAICVLDRVMHSMLVGGHTLVEEMKEPLSAFELLTVQESWTSSLCRLRNSDLDELYQLVKKHYGVTQFLCDLTAWYNQYRGRRI